MVFQDTNGTTGKSSLRPPPAAFTPPGSIRATAPGPPLALAHDPLLTFLGEGLSPLKAGSVPGDALFPGPRLLPGAELVPGGCSLNE